MTLPPCVPIALAVALGVLAAHAWALPPVWVGVLGATCVVVSLFFNRRSRLAFAALLGVWVCAGAMRARQWSYEPPQHLARLVTAEPSPGALHGVIVDDPVEVLTPWDQEQQVAVIRAQQARVNGRWQAAVGLARVRLQTPRASVAYGDDVVLEGQWSLVPSPGNPGQYDWQAALARKQIHVLFRVRPFDSLVILRHGQGHPVLAAVFRLKQRWGQLIRASFPARDAGLLLGLLLGQRAEIDERLNDAFRTTGTIHLLVISGFNVGLIAVMLDLLLRLLGLPLRPRLALSAAGLFGYWALTGMQPPVTRATVMAWAVLGALSLDRVVNWPNLLAAAALAILAAQPSQLFEPSFQLSFGAVISLLALTAPLRRLLEPHLSWGPDWLRRYAALSLASTVAIWIGLWPMLAWYFHLVAPVSVVANLVLAPLVSLIAGYGTALTFMGLAAPAILLLGRGALSALLALSIACVTTLHDLPGGAWPVGQPSWPVMVGYYALLVMALARRRLRVSLPALAACWLVSANLWLWSAVLLNRRQAAWLQVTVLDVGHGEAVAIRTPRGQRLLVDAGSHEAGQRVVVPFLRHEGWTTLDGLILTQADEDHLGGAGAVMDAVAVRRLFTNGFSPTVDVAHRMLTTEARQRLLDRPLTAGARLAGDPRVELLVLHPPEGGMPGASLTDAENATVLRLAYGDISILLGADGGPRKMPWLARWDGRLRSTAITLLHRGSRRAWEREVLARIAPRLAVVSSGRRRGLPSAETLRDLSVSGTVMLTTREAGAVTLLTDGHRLLVRPFRHVVTPQV